MKKNKSIVFLLGIYAWCSAQTISIDVAIYGEYETVKKELVYDSEGMIRQYKKIIIPTGEINELITVTKSKNGLVIEETSKNKTDVRYVTYEGNKLMIEKHYHNSDKVSHNTISKIGNDIFYTYNREVINRYDSTRKQLFDKNNTLILERKGNILYARKSNEAEITLVERKKEYMRIENQILPPIMPASIYTIRGDVSALKKAFLLNYIILPFDLRYLLFFID